MEGTPNVPFEVISHADVQNYKPLQIVRCKTYDYENKHSKIRFDTIDTVHHLPQASHSISQRGTTTSPCSDS